MLFAVACVVRLLWVVLSPAVLTSDASYYDGAAWKIANGEGYVINGRPTAYWPVGYPAFLALVYLAAGHAPTVAMLVQVLLAGGTTVLTARLISRSYGPRAGTTAGALLALSPNDSSYPALLASETVFTALFVAGIYVMLRAERPRAYAGAGMLLGLAALVRPIVVLLPVWLALVGAWRHRSTIGRSARAALPYALVFATLLLTLSPWTLRNWAALGHPVLVSTNGGINLLIGNNPEATGSYQPITNPTVLAVWHDEVQRDRAAAREALAFIVEKPQRFIELMGRRVVLLFARGWDGIYGHLRETREPIPPFTRLALYGLAEAYYAIVMIACIFSCLDRRTWTADGRFLGMVILYWILFHVVVMAEPRYRFPIMPLLIGLAALWASRRMPDAWWRAIAFTEHPAASAAISTSPKGT